MNLPADDFILLSVINTKLRDEYSSFEELCREEGVIKEEICARLSAIGFEYNSDCNAFR